MLQVYDSWADPFEYCKFGNFRDGFIFAKLHSFVKIKLSQNGEITLSFTDIGKSCSSHKFLTWQICLLTLFAKISEFTVLDGIRCVKWQTG